MCATCGCGEADVTVTGGSPGAADLPHEHPHEHGHPHPHPHEGPATGATTTPSTTLVDLEIAVLAKNDHLAAHNRDWLRERRVTALNLMSSPGSGKTSLLCRTITDLAAERPVAVIEGDQETQLDADRIRATGAPVVQINTGSGCHLDAAMLAEGLRRLAPAPGALLFVENVGNLVCPALFDLGETAKVVVVSVTEGEDKPLKYPQMFAAADVVVVNKTDLLPYVDVDLDRLTAHCRAINPGVNVLPISVTTGDGLSTWYDWVRRPLS